MPYIGGMYTGVKYIAGLVNNVDQVNALDEKLKDLVDKKKGDSVVSIFMMPYPFFSDGVSPVYHKVDIPKVETLEGYSPRNKKLLTYPYTFICVDTLNDSKEYHYEHFPDQEPSFMLACGMSPNPEIVCYPLGYNGFVLYNPTESVSCSGFPQCAFTIDSYRAWLAQGALGSLIGIAGAGIAATAGFATGNPIVGTAGLVGLASQFNDITQISTKGSKARGNQGSSTDVAIRQKAIYFKYMMVSRQYAELIDDFFDRYGYSTCRVKVPNRNVRPYWTYTKTRDVALTGEVPNEDLVKIKSIYNNGITFWNNPANVGNYNLNNSVG